MWAKIKAFFWKDSETILLARLQVVLGLIAEAITYVDPSVLAPIMPDGLSPWFIVAHGLALEYLRRRRDDSLNSPPRDPAWDV